MGLLWAELPEPHARRNLLGEDRLLVDLVEAFLGDRFAGHHRVADQSVNETTAVADGAGGDRPGGPLHDLEVGGLDSRVLGQVDLGHYYVDAPVDLRRLLQVTADRVRADEAAYDGDDTYGYGCWTDAFHCAGSFALKKVLVFVKTQ
jgi:hypothetical protein